MGDAWTTMMMLCRHDARARPSCPLSSASTGGMDFFVGPRPASSPRAEKLSPRPLEIVGRDPLGFEYALEVDLGEVLESLQGGAEWPPAFQRLAERGDDPVR
jgi:hypothetical protein